MVEPAIHTFEGQDGATLTYYEVGAGRPVVLLHGYLSAARQVWERSGIAYRLADDGHRVIMPDLRGHGESATAGAYPPDALTTDAQALIAHLGLGDYDLGGYSLGARIVARMLALGAKPARAVIAGTGLEPIVHAAGRGDNYRRILTSFGTFAPGSPEAQIEDYLTRIGADPVALSRVIDTFVDTPVSALAQVEVPTLVIAGIHDNARGSVEELAAVLQNSRLRRVPGDHETALASPELTEEVVQFLRDRPT